MTSIIASNNDSSSDSNQLVVPPAPSRQYRSKSVDVSLKLEDAKLTIDMKKNEITITPTSAKSFEPSSSNNKVHFGSIEVMDDKMHIGDKINQAFENFQDGFQILNDIRQNDSNEYKSDESNSKLTIKGPGSYIKKLIQQFSEGPFESEDSTPESERCIQNTSIKERADAICKKCLHYKGKISK